jgi:hypothetical protein
MNKKLSSGCPLSLADTATLMRKKMGAARYSCEIDPRISAILECIQLPGRVALLTWYVDNFPTRLT